MVCGLIKVVTEEFILGLSFIYANVVFGIKFLNNLKMTKYILGSIFPTKRYADQFRKIHKTLISFSPTSLDEHVVCALNTSEKRVSSNWEILGKLAFWWRQMMFPCPIMYIIWFPLTSWAIWIHVLKITVSHLEPQQITKRNDKVDVYRPRIVSWIQYYSKPWDNFSSECRLVLLCLRFC